MRIESSGDDDDNGRNSVRYGSNGDEGQGAAYGNEANEQEEKELGTRQ